MLIVRSLSTNGREQEKQQINWMVSQQQFLGKTKWCLGETIYYECLAKNINEIIK